MPRVIILYPRLHPRLILMWQTRLYHFHRLLPQIKIKRGGNKTKKKRPAKPNKRKTTKGGGYVIKADYERWPRQSTFDKPTKDIDAFEMTSFTNEFEEAIKLNFGKRQASNQDKLDQQRFLHSFALGGLNQRNQSPHQIKGDTQNLTRYCFEDLIQCCPVSDGTDTVNMPFLLALPTATSTPQIKNTVEFVPSSISSIRDITFAIISGESSSTLCASTDPNTSCVVLHHSTLSIGRPRVLKGEIFER